MQRWKESFRWYEQQRSAVKDVVSLNESTICVVRAIIAAALQWILGIALAVYSIPRSQHIFSMLQGLCEKVNSVC